MAGTITAWLLDGLLVLTLLLLAWRALSSSDLFTAIVVFIGFGLVMALVWVRLQAPDVALAEAAIGAGLTGALLLNAYAKRRNNAPGKSSETSLSSSGQVRGEGRTTVSSSLRWFVIFGFVFAVPLGWAVLSLPPIGEGLRISVEQHLVQSGVSNPVTAVLLNFRSYDTLLEIAVLLLAMLAVWVVNEYQPLSAGPPQLEFAALWGLTATLTPLLIVTAGYVLWIGSSRPGGAFQAGALLGGAAVLQIISGQSALTIKPVWVRLVTSVALLVFIAVGAALIYRGSFLQYPSPWAGSLILLIESVATVSIGAILAALFLGYRLDFTPPTDMNNPLATNKADS
ncbi:hydrogenase subunit MbhD domain-containing protein [Kaarinaea lacus]